MKGLLLIGTTGAAVAAAAAIGTMGAAAHPAAHATKTVVVAMRDPGCHWFQVGTSFRKTLAVKGPVSLQNDDMAALKVAGPGGVKLDKVGGGRLTLTRGTYRITMVGQAPDDNHLKLIVS